MVRIEIPNIDFSVYDFATIYGVGKEDTTGDDSGITFVVRHPVGVFEVEVVKSNTAEYAVVDSDMLDLITGSFILAHLLDVPPDDIAGKVLSLGQWPFTPLHIPGYGVRFGLTRDNVFVAPSSLVPSEAPTLDGEVFFKKMFNDVMKEKLKRLNVTRLNPTIRSDFTEHFHRCIDSILQKEFKVPPAFSFELNNNSITIKTNSGNSWTFSTMGIFNEPNSEEDVFAILGVRVNKLSDEPASYLELDPYFGIVDGKNYLA